jgi:hypothetical protein
MTPEEYIQTSDGNLLKVSYKMMQSDKQKGKGVPGGSNQSSLGDATGKLSKAEIARDVAKKAREEYEKMARDAKARGEHISLPNPLAKAIAEPMGFEKRNNPPFDTHGKAAFYNPKTKKWISADKNGHNGGVWKMFDDKIIKRNGTYNIDLTVRIKD